MKKTTAFLFGIACALIMVIAPFLTKSESVNEGQTPVILSVWQIDSFEGGSGSRTAFLRKVLSEFSKKNPLISVVVSSQTPTSANNLLKQGNFPDVISYGACSVELQGYAKSLPFKAQGGGAVGAKCFAVPFLKGGYFVIKKGEGDKKVIVSTSEYSTSEIACLFSKNSFDDYLFLSHQDAYATFLNRKNAVMVGSQRDIIRLLNRGENFDATPISDYSDIFQYLSVTSSKNLDASVLMVEYLIGSSVQNKVSEINMLSPYLKGLYQDNKSYALLEDITPSYTLSAFSTKEHLAFCKQHAVSLLLSKGDKGDIIKYLKQL